MPGRFLTRVFITYCVSVVKKEILLEHILNVAQTYGEHSGSHYCIMHIKTAYLDKLSIAH